MRSGPLQGGFGGRSMGRGLSQGKPPPGCSNAGQASASGAIVAGAQSAARELRVIGVIGDLIHRGDFDDFEQVEL